MRALCWRLTLDAEAASDLQQETWARAVQDDEAAHLVQGYRGMPANDMLRVIGELPHAEMLPAMYPRLDRWREVRATLDPEHRLCSDMDRRLDLTGRASG